MAKPRHDYRPHPETLARFPEISGNAVNGLGESARRRPSPFFWHPPERQTHGELQRFVVQRFRPQGDDDHSFRNPRVDRGPKPIPVAAQKTERSAEAWSAELKAFALANEADLVGITPMREEYVFEGYRIEEPWLVLVGVAHDYPRLSRAPDRIAYNDMHDQYNRGARAVRRMANFLRGHGYRAESYPGPMADALNMIPAALACGFGELGKHGSLIHRRYGSAFRLAALSTDLPLIADAPEQFGADGFCLHCQVCRDACPPDAIHEDKQVVRGERKWYVDFDKCIPYFGENLACGICIAVCPWSRPGVAERLVVKLAQRASRR